MSDFKNPSGQSSSLTWVFATNSGATTISSAFPTYVTTGLSVTVTLPYAQTPMLSMVLNAFTADAVCAAIVGYTINGGSTVSIGQETIGTATNTRAIISPYIPTQSVLSAGTYTFLIVACKAVGTSWSLEGSGGGIGIDCRFGVGYAA